MRHFSETKIPSRNLRSSLSPTLTHWQTLAQQRDSCVIETFEDKFVLDIYVVSDGNTLDHVDVLDVLATKEVLDLNAGAILGDDGVDGEMSIYQPHFVHKALGDTGDHVINVRFERVNSAGLPVAAEPHADSEVRSFV